MRWLVLLVLVLLLLLLEEVLLLEVLMLLVQRKCIDPAGVRERERRGGVRRGRPRGSGGTHEGSRRARWGRELVEVHFERAAVVLVPGRAGPEGVLACVISSTPTVASRSVSRGKGQEERDINDGRGMKKQLK